MKTCDSTFRRLLPAVRRVRWMQGLCNAAAGAAALVLAACAAISPAAPPQAAGAALRGPLAIEKQGSFFIGGRELKSDTLSTLPAFAPTGTITVDQMYVHYQVPAGAKQLPMVLIHGCCLTGTSWETTPDGRMGWDEYFVRTGHPTYVIDQASRGRSATDPSGIVSAKLGKSAPRQLPAVFAAGREGAWTIFRFGPEYPKAFPGLQFPLEAQGELWKQMVPDWSAALPVPNPTVPALSQLAQRIGPAVLVSHSQSGIYPFQTAALSNKGIAGIVAIEPGSCPAADGDMKPYVAIPALLLFGDFVDQSTGWWVPRFKACQAFAQAVNRAGGRIDVVRLPDVGIKGNSHMMMQDRNNLEVADWLSDWIRRKVEQRP